MASSKQRLWTKNYTLAFFSKSLNAISFSVVITTMATYAMRRFEVGEGVAGAIAGSFVFFTMLGRLYSGYCMENHSAKRMLLASSAGLVVVTLPYCFNLPLLPFVILLAFHGVVFGFCSNSVTAISTSVIPKNRLGEGIGYLGLSTTLSTALGPFLGLMLLNNGLYLGYHLIFAVFAAAGFIVSVPIKADAGGVGKRKLKTGELQSGSKGRSDDLAHGQVGIDEERLIGIWRFIDRKALPASAAAFISALCYSGMSSFVSPYFSGFGLAETVPIYFIVFSVAMMLIRPFAGTLQDRFGDAAVLVPSLAFYFLAPIVCIILPIWYGMCVVAVLMALGYGAAFSILQTMAVRRSLGDHIGLATSTYFMCADLGSAVGPAILGSMIALVSYAGMFIAMAFVVAVLFAYCQLIVFPRVGK